MKIAKVGLRHVATIVLAASCGISAAVQAGEIYKWVDNRGVTHYSDIAPKDLRAAKMADGMGRLSVIPTAKPAATAASPSTLSAPTQGPLKITELYTADEKAKLAQWREQCIAERWVDCDDRRALFSRYGTMADGFATARPLARVAPAR